MKKQRQKNLAWVRETLRPRTNLRVPRIVPSYGSLDERRPQSCRSAADDQVHGSRYLIEALVQDMLHG